MTKEDEKLLAEIFQAILAIENGAVPQKTEFQLADCTVTISSEEEMEDEAPPEDLN
ncbi:MAG: hypothetical protein ACOYUZ_04005 [Patescibacteria group bacterium]